MNNRTIRCRTAAALLLANGLSLAIAGQVRAQDASGGDNPQLDELQRRLDAQTAELRSLRSDLADQERNVLELQRALDAARLGQARARGDDAWYPQDPTAPPGGYPPDPTRQPQERYPVAVGGDEARMEPVGRGPQEGLRPPEVPQIFDQPGVLTPRGEFVFEPSLQFGYSSNSRVALIGYTVVPAILIGLVDVRQVKTTTMTATLTGRYGLTNRLEIEARLPYVYANMDTLTREIFTGSAIDRVFNSQGEGMGDAEITARYQINQGDADTPYFIGWLRYKSTTGTDPFEVVTDCVQRCVQNTTGTGWPLKLPTGSGFEAIQPGLTWLYASDPVVFFGSFSYLYNLSRDDVSRTVLSGAPEGFPQTTTEFIGDVDAGDIWGFNLGMGLALNEKAAISIGYDQSFVGKTQQNGQDAPGAVRVVLGTLVLGGTYRFNENATLNIALGVGVTRDTPDTTLTMRVPITF